MALMSPQGVHTPMQAQAAQKAAENGPTLAPPGSMPGAQASDTADNIPAKLSEGELVIPAYAVRYYGLNHFHKLFKQAQDGLHEMDQNDLIKSPAPPPQSSSPNTQAPTPPTPSAGGGFFATGGIPAPKMTVNAPGAANSRIGFKIPHNTGILHTGIASPFHRNMSDPKVRATVKLATGGFMDNGFMNTDFSGQPPITASGPSIYKPNNTGLGGYPYGPTVQ